VAVVDKESGDDDLKRRVNIGGERVVGSRMSF